MSKLKARAVYSSGKTPFVIAMLASVAMLALPCSHVSAGTLLEKQGQEEGGIGGTGIRQDDLPDELFEEPELVDSIEDSVEINDVLDNDIPESPEAETEAGQ